MRSDRSSDSVSAARSRGEGELTTSQRMEPATLPSFDSQGPEAPMKCGPRPCGFLVSELPNAPVWEFGGERNTLSNSLARTGLSAVSRGPQDQRTDRRSRVRPVEFRAGAPVRRSAEYEKTSIPVALVTTLACVSIYASDQGRIALGGTSNLQVAFHSLAVLIRNRLAFHVRFGRRDELDFDRPGLVR